MKKDSDLLIGLKLCEELYNENDNIKVLKIKEGKCIILEMNTNLYICWIGLEDFEILLNKLKKISDENLMINNVNCGKVHGEFFNYYSLLREDTNKIVNEFIKKNTSNKRIICIGYSLGASIILNALDIKLSLKNKNEVEIKTIILGSPKIGDDNFVKIFNTEITDSLNILDENDIINEFPLELNYNNINKMIILKDEIKRKNCFFQYLEILKNSCFRRQKNNNKRYYHSITNYKNKINNLLKLL